MSKETLARLFRPFVRAKALSSDSPSGTGLGLVISQRLVTIMRGRLTFNSMEGVGTEVIIQIPFRSVPVPAHAAERKDSDPPKQLRGTILVVVRLHVAHYPDAMLVFFRPPVFFM